LVKQQTAEMKLQYSHSTDIPGEDKTEYCYTEVTKRKIWSHPMQLTKLLRLLPCMVIQQLSPSLNILKLQVFFSTGDFFGSEKPKCLPPYCFM